MTTSIQMRAPCHAPPSGRHFLSEAECRELFERILKLGGRRGGTFVSVASRWTGTTRWTANRIRVAEETQSVALTIARTVHEIGSEVTTTRIDDDGLREAVEAAERLFALRAGRGVRFGVLPDVNAPMSRPTVWSDATFQQSAEARTQIVREMLQTAADVGLFSAGTLKLSAHGHAAMDTNGLFRYYPATSAECSMTVRNARARASGWAGDNSFDIAQLDPTALARKALDHCQRSKDAVSIEPGRYTAILEPQAVHDLFAPVGELALDRGAAEMGWGPFAGAWEESASKIGTQVVDNRFVLSADPMDPEASFIPFDEDGTPYRAVRWIDRGYLRDLGYDRSFAVQRLGSESALPNSGSFRLSAASDVPVTSIDAMIASTERGIYVSRLSNIELVHPQSMLCTGYTRDGTWLIEKGKITKPITNFRITESPLFIMNRVEAIGAPTRVFAPGYARLVPALAVRDFNFSSMADAV